MRVQLHPSVLRGAMWVLSWLVAVTAIAYVRQGFYEHHWWTRNYFFSLLIPFAIAPAFVCFMAVPSQLEFTDSNFIIRFPFRRSHTAAWDDLEYYGWFEGVYGLQFPEAGTFSLLPHALPRAD